MAANNIANLSRQLEMLDKNQLIELVRKPDPSIPNAQWLALNRLKTVQDMEKRHAAEQSRNAPPMPTTAAEIVNQEVQSPAPAGYANGGILTGRMPVQGFEPGGMPMGFGDMPGYTTRSYALPKSTLAEEWRKFWNPVKRTFELKPVGPRQPMNRTSVQEIVKDYADKTRGRAAGEPPVTIPGSFQNPNKQASDAYLRGRAAGTTPRTPAVPPEIMGPRQSYSPRLPAATGASGVSPQVRAGMPSFEDNAVVPYSGINTPAPSTALRNELIRQSKQNRIMGPPTPSHIPYSRTQRAQAETARAQKEYQDRMALEGLVPFNFGEKPGYTIPDPRMRPDIPKKTLPSRTGGITATSAVNWIGDILNRNQPDAGALAERKSRLDAGTYEEDPLAALNRRVFGKGSGPGQRVTRQDIADARERIAASEGPPSPFVSEAERGNTFAENAVVGAGSSPAPSATQGKKPKAPKVSAIDQGLAALAPSAEPPKTAMEMYKQNLAELGGGKQQALIDQFDADRQGQQKSDFWNAVGLAGMKMASSKSPYALQQIGEGGQEFFKQNISNLKDQKKLDQALLGLRVDYQKSLDSTSQALASGQISADQARRRNDIAYEQTRIQGITARKTTGLINQLEAIHGPHQNWTPKIRQKAESLIVAQATKAQSQFAQSAWVAIQQLKKQMASQAPGELYQLKRKFGKEELTYQHIKTKMLGGEATPEQEAWVRQAEREYIRKELGGLPGFGQAYAWETGGRALGSAPTSGAISVSRGADGNLTFNRP